MRAELLEDQGYAVDMIEFIDFEHSPKNLMIRARKQGAKNSRNEAHLRALSARYGFEQTLLGLLSQPEEQKTP